MSQIVDTLTQPIATAESSNPPLVIRTITSRNLSMAGGVPSQGTVMHEYILVSALPQELKERVILAINILSNQQ